MIMGTVRYTINGSYDDNSSQNVYVNTQRNFISQLYTCKMPKKKILTEKALERYWTEKKIVLQYVNKK